MSTSERKELLLNHKKKTVIKNWVFCSTLPAVIIISLLAFFSEVGQVVWMPLWIDSAITNKNMTVTENSKIGSYPVVVVSSIFEFILFLLAFIIFGKYGTNERYSNWKLLSLVGISNSINSVLTPFVSSGKKNPPYLQGLLLNSYVPFTVIVRFFVLKRSPTLKKFICVIVVTIALVISLLPNIIPSLRKLSGIADGNGITGFESFLWAFGFMIFAVLPAVIMNVGQEKILKNNQYQKLSPGTCITDSSVDIFFMNLVMAFFQLVFAACLIWLDVIPVIGESNSINETIYKSKKALECSLMIGNCDNNLFAFTWAFITCYFFSYIASSFMIKYAEGSTFFAMVMNLVTPGVVLFWVLFNETPFEWHPHFNITKWFSVASVLLMLPAIVIYTLGEGKKFYWNMGLVTPELLLLVFTFLQLILIHPDKHNQAHCKFFGNLCEKHMD